MARLIAVLVFVLLSASGAVAGAIDDIRQGNDAFAAGRKEEALQAYTRAIVSGELDAEALALAYNNRGVVYNELGDFDRAIADYREALALVPGDPTALRNLRVAYTRRGVAQANFGEFERALDDLGRAIELEPSHHLAWLRRAEVRMEMGDLEGAARDLAEAETRRAGDAEIAAARERLAARVEEARQAAAAAASRPMPDRPASPAAQPAAVGAKPAPDIAPAPVSEATAATSATAAAAAASAARPETTEAATEEKRWQAVAAVNVRAGPSNEHPVVRVIRRGETVRVLGETRGWKEILFDDGAKGFVYRKWLEPVADSGREG